MRKKHKNELFKVVQESGLAIEKFEIKEDLTKEHPTLIISLINTPFEFIIRTSPDSFNSYDYRFSKYAPTYPLSDFLPITGYTDIESVITDLKFWLKNDIPLYFEDQNEPDLWEEFKSGNKSFNFNKIDFDDKTQFTLDERTQIKLSLNELKFLIRKNISVDEKAQEIIEARLDYLIEASQRLNRFDWKGLAISTLISLTMTLSLDTESGRLLFELFKKVFSNVPQLTP